MTWKNLGYQPHPWRAATGAQLQQSRQKVKTSRGEGGRLGSTASLLPIIVYAGRLRLVLECEEHGRSRCWLAGWSTSCPRPIAFHTGYSASPFLPSIQARGQNPAREARAPRAG